MMEMIHNGMEGHSICEIFPEGISLEDLDDSLFRVRDNREHGGQVVGLLELLKGRYPVFYTTMPAKHSDRWVREIVDGTPRLDRVWFSPQILSAIWEHARITNHPSRYVHLGFEHEAKFEESGEDSEHRRYKAYLSDQIGILDQVWPNLKELYDPFHSLVFLQIPARNGSYSLNYNGKVTNHGNSFLEYRATVDWIAEFYNKITRKAEEILWFHTTPVGDSGYQLNGAPLSVLFDKRLSEDEFTKFVAKGLKDRQSKLQIGGFIHPRGRTKIHMSAIDRHLWQPFNMEVTSRHIVALLPKETSGSFVHRLATNIQRYVVPKVQVWLGETSYEIVIQRAIEEPRSGA